MDTKQHWDNIYATKAENEVSWFEAYPKVSVEFLETFHLPRTANIIDIGGGDSHLVNVLLEKGYENIWVLDISEKAIERAKKRLGQQADSIHWIISDINDFNFKDLQFDLWHDRAAFHFLTSEEKIYKYVFAAEDAVRKGGFLLIGTFSEQGPAKCSGLDIKQYSETSIAARFGVYFEKIKCVNEDHMTPFNTAQNFLFCSFKRK